MIELGLFTNRNSHKDFVHTALSELGDLPSNVYIAVAFFTDATIVQHLVSRGSTVRLIVRLGFPTQAYALQGLLDRAGVEIRYFTAPSFHPKLYLFGDRAALVGSANMTDSALWSNQEVCVLIDSDDPRLQELSALFNFYWNHARVLTREVLRKYEEVMAGYKRMRQDETKMADDVKAKVGHVEVPNIGRDEATESKENLFIEDFRKTYQEFLSAFSIVRRIYERVGKRKASAGLIPLRLEIDGFVSFVRETVAKGSAWKETALSSGPEREKYIEALIRKWHETPWAYFEEEVVPENYPRLIRVFGAPETIRSASDEELVDALDTVHAFRELLRFVKGGLDSLHRRFVEVNEGKRLRDCLIYLLYGPHSAEERMANLLFSPAYKLNMFGQSCVQEMIGWVNREDLPVVNGRTTKVMRYLGFDVRQLSGD